MPTELPVRAGPLKPPIPEVDNVPGCGLAAYVGLLVVGCVLGMVGMANASWQIMNAPDAIVPRELRPGVQIAVWQLAPMRKAGVSGLTEAPDAWHDESPMWDGTVACALFADRVAKVDGEAAYTIPYTTLDTVQAEGDEYGDGVKVHLAGRGKAGEPVSFTCNFGPEEGGSRFATQLETEIRQNQPGSPG